MSIDFSGSHGCPLQEVVSQTSPMVRLILYSGETLLDHRIMRYKQNENKKTVKFEGSFQLKYKAPLELLSVEKGTIVVVLLLEVA